MCYVMNTLVAFAFAVGENGLMIKGSRELTEVETFFVKHINMLATADNPGAGMKALLVAVHQLGLCDCAHHQDQQVPGGDAASAWHAIIRIAPCLESAQCRVVWVDGVRKPPGRPGLVVRALVLHDPKLPHYLAALKTPGGGNTFLPITSIRQKKDRAMEITFTPEFQSGEVPTWTNRGWTLVGLVFGEITAEKKSKHNTGAGDKDRAAGDGGVCEAEGSDKDSAAGDRWTCGACTFVNERGHLACSVCGTQMPTAQGKEVKRTRLLSCAPK
jgi:hypothetical protein